MELQVDCCASMEEAAAMMSTMFDKNPIGVDFDPDDWLDSATAKPNLHSCHDTSRNLYHPFAKQSARSSGPFSHV